MALVSARGEDGSKPAASASNEDSDVDLKRARDLIELHYSIKVAGETGQLERILREARAVVKERDTAE